MSDPVLDVLLDLARASHPSIFVPDELPPPTSGYPRQWTSPPGSAAYSLVREFVERFEVAVGRDDTLRQFAQAPTEDGLMIRASTGVGWRAPPRDLPAQLVTSAAINVFLKDRPRDSLEPLLEEVKIELETFRRLVAGEPAEALALTGFEGFAVPAGERLETPWGELRAPNELERQFQLFGNVEASAVLQFKIPVSFKIGETPDAPEANDPELKTSRRIAEAGGLIPFAVVLATADTTYVIADAIWQTTITPAHPGSAFTGRLPRPRSPFAQREPSVLTEAQAVEVTRWAHTVDAHYDRVVEIAVRRTMSAIRERLDREDAVIDAVVAWENLFGHADGTSEVTFRVTTAIARLLEADAAKREELRRALKEVYNVRSRVVHGSPIRPRDRLEERASLAIDIAVRCLRALFAERPELITDPERAMRVLLED